MLKHHEESLEILVRYFKDKPETIAVVFGGSVARGCERPDSDLDAMIIITDEAYEERRKTNTTVETIVGMCTYEGGYFDVKYMTKTYLRIAAEKASEPTRNSFMSSRVLYTLDEEINELVSRIPVFQESESEDKMLSFYSDLSLNYNYFWKSCAIDGYMKIRTAGEIIYSIYRMILQENKIFFPSNRRMEEYVANAPKSPENIVELAADFIRVLDDTTCDAFVKAFLGWTSFVPPEDYNQILGRYVADFEQWWMKPRPLIAEW